MLTTSGLPTSPCIPPQRLCSHIGFLPSWHLPACVPSRVLSPAWGLGMPFSIPSVPIEGLLGLPGSGQTPLESLLQCSLIFLSPSLQLEWIYLPPGSCPLLPMHVFRPLVYCRYMFARLSLPVIVTLKGSVYEFSPALSLVFHYRYLKDGHWIKLNYLLNCSFDC